MSVQEKEAMRDRDESEVKGALDVASLMEQVRLEAPRGAVTVRGIVGALRPFPSSEAPTHVYGDLRDSAGGSTISFRCGATVAPRAIDEPVVLRGTLTIKKARMHRGYDLELVGGSVGVWSLPEPAGLSVALPETIRPKVTLERFFSEGAKRLLLIGTKRAIEDAENTANRGAGRLFDTRVSSTALESEQLLLEESARTYDGLCLARGGGDPDSFSAWKDHRLIESMLACGKPVYTALGHTSDVTLADKYADQSFVTPSDFGAACTEAWKTRLERNRLRDRIRSLEKENGDLEKARAEANPPKLDALQTVTAELYRLPAFLGKEAGRQIDSAVKASLRGEFQQPIATAIQGPLADLRQATLEARGVFVRLTRKSRFQTWTWLLCVFLLGALMGGFACFYAGVATLDRLEDRFEQLSRQQVAPPPAAAPSPARKRLRE